MKRNNYLLFAMLGIYAIMLFFFRPGEQPKTPAPVPAASKVTLPAGLQVDPAAREPFQKALQAEDLGARDPENKNKHYNEAINTLQQIANKDKASAAGVAAVLEVAYQQWHSLDEKETAALTLRDVKLLPLPPSLQVPVRSGKSWIMVPAHTYAEQMYDQIVRAINEHNRTNFGYKFFAGIVWVFQWAGPYKGAMALILLGVLVSILLTPVRNWQFRSMGRMGKLQPEMKRIQQDYKGKPEEMNRRMMELYKEHGYNPAMGCLPMLVQLPFMWALYYAIRQYQFELNGKFLWIGSHFSLTHAGWATPKGPIIATNLAQMDIPLLILYAVSMYFYSKFMPVTTADPAQAKQSQQMSATMSLMMPFMFYFYNWPSAFILWWLAMNVAQILITVFYLRHHPDLKAMFNPPKTTGDDMSAAVGSKSSGARNVTPGGGKGATSSTNGMGSATGSRVNGSSAGGSSSGSGTASSARRIEPKNRRKPRGRRF